MLYKITDCFPVVLQSVFATDIAENIWLI